MFQAKQIKSPPDLWLERNPAALMETRKACLTAAWSKVMHSVSALQMGVTMVDRAGGNINELGTFVPAHLYYTVAAHRNTEIDEMPVMHVETHLFKREPETYLAHVANNYNVVLLNAGWPRIMIATRYFRDTQLAVTNNQGRIGLTEFNKNRFAEKPFTPIYINVEEAVKLFDSLKLSTGIDVEGLSRPIPSLVRKMDPADEKILEDVIDLLIERAGPNIADYKDVVDRIIIDREIGKVRLSPTF